MSEKKDIIPDPLKDPIAALLAKGSSVSPNILMGLLENYKPMELNKYLFRAPSMYNKIKDDSIQKDNVQNDEILFPFAQIQSQEKSLDQQNNVENLRVYFNILEYFLHNAAPVPYQDYPLPSWDEFNVKSNSLPYPLQYSKKSKDDEEINKSPIYTTSLIAWYLVSLGVDISRSGTKKLIKPFMRAKKDNDKNEEEEEYWDIATIAFEKMNLGFVHALFAKNGPLENSEYPLAKRVYSSRQEYKTPWLHRIVSQSTPKMVKAFIDLGCDPNGLDLNGNTPLFYAKSPQMVATLIKAGCDPSTVNKNGSTAENIWQNNSNFNAKEKRELSKSILTSLKDIEKTNPDLIDWDKIRDQWIIDLPGSSKTSALASYKKLKAPDDLHLKMEDADGNILNITPALYLGIHTISKRVFNKITHPFTLWTIDTSDLSVEVKPNSGITNLDMLGVCALYASINSSGLNYMGQNQENFIPLIKQLPDILSKMSKQPQIQGDENLTNEQRVLRRLARASLILSKLPPKSYTKSATWNEATINKPASFILSLFSFERKEFTQLSQVFNKKIPSLNYAKDRSPVSFEGLTNFVSNIKSVWHMADLNANNLENDLLSFKSFDADTYNNLLYHHNINNGENITVYEASVNHADRKQVVALRFKLSKDIIDKCLNGTADDKDILSITNLVFGSIYNRDLFSTRFNLILEALPYNWTDDQLEDLEISKYIQDAFYFVLNNENCIQLMRENKKNAWNDYVESSEDIVNALNTDSQRYRNLSKEEKNDLFAICKYIISGNLKLDILHNNDDLAKKDIVKKRKM